MKKTLSLVLASALALNLAACSGAPSTDGATDDGASDDALKGGKVKSLVLHDLADHTIPATPVWLQDGTNPFMQTYLVLGNATKVTIKNSGTFAHDLMLTEIGSAPMTRTHVAVGATFSFTPKKDAWYDLQISYTDISGNAATWNLDFQAVKKAPSGGGGGGGVSGPSESEQCEAAGGRWVVQVESGMGCDFSIRNANENPLPGGG